MGRRFGTDGVRGEANLELTPELAFALGRAGAHVLAKYANTQDKVSILVGKDTRISGDMLEAALVSGILSVGADAYLVGVVPTPAVAYLTAHKPVEAGVMISASHNPAEDNGIKFFSHAGFKLPDELEDEIEYYLDNPDSLPRPSGDAVGKLNFAPDWRDDYLEHLLSAAETRLDGLKIVVDCANGAASKLGPELFQRLGAEVFAISNQPNGININVTCGSTHPQAAAELVRAKGADLGLAFDGDADRLIAVDEQGEVIDGDAIMAVCALDLKQKGRLPGNTLVATVMSNLGLEQAMQDNGIRLLRSKVGDRYVLALMRETGASLGGEQSGHIIFSDYSTTGDGMLTALQLAQIIAKARRPLSALAGVLTPYPQVLYNVRVADKALVNAEEVKSATVQAEGLLRSSGRLLVRPSGTEPVVRVMVEAVTRDLAEEAAKIVVTALEKQS